MAEKFFLGCSQHDASFDKRETKKKFSMSIVDLSSQTDCLVCCLLRRGTSIYKTASCCPSDILKYVQNHLWHSFNLFMRRNPLYSYFIGGPETLSIL